MEIVQLIIPNVLRLAHNAAGRRILRHGRQRGRRFRFARRQHCVKHIDGMIGFAGDSGARHPHHIVLGVDAPDLEAARHTVPVAHVAGHLGAGKYARLVATGANVAAPPMRLGVAVRRGHSLEAVPLADALEAAVDAERARKESDILLSVHASGQLN